MKHHEPFWLDLIRPYRERFGENVEQGYMKMRAIIHHLFEVIYSNTKPLDLDMLEKKTGYSKEKIVRVIEFLKEQEVIDFEIQWTV